MKSPPPGADQPPRARHDRYRHLRVYSLPVRGCRCPVPAPRTGQWFGVREGINKLPSRRLLRPQLDIGLHKVLMLIKG